MIAMPYEHDRLRYGVGRGPEHLLESGAEEALASAGASVTTQWIELGPDQEDEIDACFELIAKIATAVREARAAGAFPVVLSGSCFAGVGVVAGLDEPTPAVIYFDAHGDFNDPETATFGYFDGMPVAILTGRAWQTLLAGVPGARPLTETSIVHVGARDFEPPERRVFEASALLRLGPERLRTTDALVEATAGLDPAPSGVYVHVDLDVLDGDDGGVNIYSAPNGVSGAELEALVRSLLDGFPVRALSLTAYDPTYDKADRVPAIASRLLTAAGEHVERVSARSPSR